MEWARNLAEYIEEREADELQQFSNCKMKKDKMNNKNETNSK